MGKIKSSSWIQKNFLRIFLWTFFLSLFGFVLLSSGAYLVWIKEKDGIQKKMDRYLAEVKGTDDPRTITPITILDRNGKEIGVFFRKNFRPIRTDNLKDHYNLVWALLSSEDREFYSHGGLNYNAILRALVVNLTRFKLSQGGSTISQQLAKLSLNLGERNIFNKMVELYCTFYLESTLEKDSILAIYINQIFLGEGNVGMEEASQYYFEKSAKRLTPEEAALLVGIIPAPSVYNPIRNLQFALTKQKRILYEMAKQKELHPSPSKMNKNFGITIEESIRKFHKLYNIKEVQWLGKSKLVSDIGSKGYDKDFRKNLAPDFNMEIRKYILERFTEEELDTLGLRITTTLDIEKQKIAQVALLEGVEAAKKGLREAYANLDPEKNSNAIQVYQNIEKSMNGGLVSINPFTGEIEAMVGSLNISRTFRFNRVEGARRQPGSVIKALVYVLAFEEKIIHPFSIVNDEPISIKGYSPKNWYRGFRGEMTARLALAQSVNTISVKLLNQIGMDVFLDKLGSILSLPSDEIRRRFPRNLTLALGSGELSPLELSIIYATIQNGGKKIFPKKILKIEDNLESQYFTLENAEPDAEQILDPIACAQAVQTLEAVLSHEGTVKVDWKKDSKFPIAGKTGSVQFPKEARKKWGNLTGIRDAWFGGMAAGLSTAVWIGNDHGAPFPGSGAGLTGKVWLKYIFSLSRSSSIGFNLVPNPSNEGYVKLDVCADDGYLLNNRDCAHPLLGQYFYKDLVPAIGETTPVAIPIPVAAADEEEGVELEANEGDSEEAIFSLESTLPSEDAFREIPSE